MPEAIAANFSTASPVGEPIMVSSRAQRSKIPTLSEGMCFFFSSAAILCLATICLPGIFYDVASAADEPARPRILGIAGVTITAPHDSEGFYTKLGFANDMIECLGVCLSHFALSSDQELAILDRAQFDELTQKPKRNNLNQITFATADIEGLHSYLAARGIQTSEIFKRGIVGANPLFWVVDPELHQIGFVQLKTANHYKQSGKEVSNRLIHAGFVVQERTAMEHFYKDILGFRPYWHGGMKDNQTDWLDMQVPDGSDWIEFMLNVPANADQKLLGVMNHIALGVPDIHAAQKQLLTNGMKLSEEPKIGRDGKWQLNLYDPDDTRVELMEFTPSQKPCCSDYTGPHPKP
jgi:catechol 2,3-dioxygenase-like lactoylglutathione lyase family enzyme